MEKEIVKDVKVLMENLKQEIDLLAQHKECWDRQWALQEVLDDLEAIFDGKF